MYYLFSDKFILGVNKMKLQFVFKKFWLAAGITLVMTTFIKDVMSIPFLIWCGITMSGILEDFNYEQKQIAADNEEEKDYTFTQKKAI